ANLREFFKDSLHGALTKQRVSVEDQTEHYVVNVLTLFARSEALYDSTPEGMRLRPLVALLGEALEATCRTERNRALQRLGDVSLFIAGFFAHSFAERLIDIDYAIGMGGRAYAVLAEANSRGRARVLGAVFAELAVPLDRRRECYRYHRLLADVLRAYLHRQNPALEPALHKRASAWYEANQQPGQAIRHLRAAGDVGRAAQLVLANLPDYQGRGDLESVQTWLDGFSDAQTAGHPALALAAAWCALERGDAAAV